MEERETTKARSREVGWIPRQSLKLRGFRSVQMGMLGIKQEGPDLGRLTTALGDQIRDLAPCNFQPLPSQMTEQGPEHFIINRK